MRKIHTVLVFLSLLVSPALSKDSQPARSGRASSATEQYLNAAADAVLNLKSAQFSLKREGTPAFLDEKNGITFTVAECSYAAPDRVSCNVKVSLKNGNILQLTRVWVPEGMFQTNPLTRQFGKAPRGRQFQRRCAVCQDRHCGHSAHRDSEAPSCGQGKTSGKDTLHLKGEVSGEKLNPLVGSTLKPEFMYPVDLWMDEKSCRPGAGSRQRARGQRVAHRARSRINEPVDIPTPQAASAPAAQASSLNVACAAVPAADPRARLLPRFHRRTRSHDRLGRLAGSDPIADDRDSEARRRRLGRHRATSCRTRSA